MFFQRLYSKHKKAIERVAFTFCVIAAGSLYWIDKQEGTQKQIREEFVKTCQNSVGDLIKGSEVFCYYVDAVKNRPEFANDMAKQYLLAVSVFNSPRLIKRPEYNQSQLFTQQMRAAAELCDWKSFFSGESLNAEGIGACYQAINLTQTKEGQHFFDLPTHRTKEKWSADYLL